MQTDARTRILPSGAVVRFLLWTVAFGIAFTQWPLFSENQNTKFLHGLAAAGSGLLATDWLANTIDPLPLFSALVELTVRLLHPWFFYFYHGLLLGLYLFSLTGIAAHIFALDRTVVGRPLFMTVMIWLHAGLLWPFSVSVLGTSLGWLLQAGVANQYLLNPVFQPSTFGVLLFVSIYLFLQRRPHWAVVSAGAAALFHSTYLPSAALLTLAYLLLLWREDRSLRRLMTVGLSALAVVTPVLLYSAVRLGPTSAVLFAQSQAIIVNERIPQHSLIEVWFDHTVYVKLGLVLLALWLVRRTRLFAVMAVSFAAAFVLTAAQMALHADLLAFVAPWRTSVFLVPLATGMIVAALSATAAQRATLLFDSRWLLALIGLVLAAVVLTGARAIAASVAARAAEPINGVYGYVQAHRAPGDLYLVPTSLADFRLAAGVPVVIT